MRVIPVAPIPNQSFTVTLNGVRWGLVIKEARGATVVDITRNSDPRLMGVRALAGEPLIPYAYLEDGNFIFVTTRQQLLMYQQFGVSQFLVYLTAAEVNNVPAITAGRISTQTVRPQYLTTDDGFYLTTDAGELLTDD